MHFQPLHNEVKSVLGIKESYSMGKKVLKFSQIEAVRLMTSLIQLSIVVKESSAKSAEQIKLDGVVGTF